MSPPPVSPRAAPLLLLLLLLTALLSHTLAQPSPAVRSVFRTEGPQSETSYGRVSQGLLEEVAGAARHAGGHSAPRARDARLPLPTPQEIDALRKVAQILAMLGEQVIPALVGPAASAPAAPPAVATADAPADDVDDD